MLTDRQRRFVDEYLKDFNGSRAAIRAGYSEKGAAVAAARLLTLVKVQEAVLQAQQSRIRQAGITQDKVLSELARIGFSDIRKVVAWASGVVKTGEDPETGAPVLDVTNEVRLVDSDQIDGDTAAAIAEISQGKDGGLKIKLHDKRAALVDIGRHLGMFRAPGSKTALAPAASLDTQADQADDADGWGSLLH